MASTTKVMTALIALENCNDLDEIFEDPYVNLENIAIKRGFLLKGGIPDINKVCIIFLNELRGNKIGAMSYERPSEIE